MIFVETKDRETQTNEKIRRCHLRFSDGPMQGCITAVIADAKGGTDLVETKNKGLKTESGGEMKSCGTFVVARERRCLGAQQRGQEGDLIGDDATFERRCKV